jgi:hypothetical protein
LRVEGDFNMGQQSKLFPQSADFNAVYFWFNNWSLDCKCVFDWIHRHSKFYYKGTARIIQKLGILPSTDPHHSDNNSWREYHSKVPVSCKSRRISFWIFAIPNSKWRRKDILTIIESTRFYLKFKRRLVSYV